MNRNTKKPTAKELVKNKNAMARLRKEGIVRNYMVRKASMARAGNRPQAQLMKLKKAPVSAAAGARTNTNANKANNKNALHKSMNAYKYQLAIPFAKTGLHNPKNAGYHNELVQNMKNFQKNRPSLVAMHNKEWFVNQLKRNVWALKNNRTLTKPIAAPKNTSKAAPVTACGAMKKTHKLMLDRKGKKAPKPKALTAKQLTNQLKAVTNRLKAAAAK